MRTISPKLILIIVISILLISLLSIWIIKTFLTETPTEEISREKLFEEVLQKVPMSGKERIIKMYSSIKSSSDEISQFIIDIYDENYGGFKIRKDSTASLEATYYGIEALENLGSLNKITNFETILDKVHSFYVLPGYYSEDGNDPVFSTKQALKIDRWFQEDLGQKINLDWLENNSIKNKNLEENKLNPEYQAAVLEIYQHLTIPKEEKFEELEKISYYYYDYYGNFKLSEEISDSDYLKTKYYQISLISDLSGINNVEKLAGNYFKMEDIKADKEKLSSFSYEDIQDIKEVYWLYYLQKFYSIELDLDKVLKKVEGFYFGGGIKEKLTDETSNLIGTYYGTLFIK